MDIIDVKFDGNKMFYSTKSKISNDFHFTVTKGKDADSQLKSNRLEDTNDAPPTISILGLEYLFDKQQNERYGKNSAQYAYGYGYPHINA